MYRNEFECGPEILGPVQPNQRLCACSPLSSDDTHILDPFAPTFAHPHTEFFFTSSTLPSSECSGSHALLALPGNIRAPWKQ